MAESSELFELKNFFAIGSYQAAINAGSSIPQKNLSESDKLTRDVYIYRSYIALGNHRFVLSDIKDSAPTALLAVKLLATYLSNPENKDIALITVKEWMSDGNSATNPVLQLVAATIYYHEENYEEAMRCVYQSNSLEGLAMLIQIYLKINRIDQAEKELKGMHQMDEDATITQIASAWVHIAQGGEKISEAQAIFQDMLEKYGASVLLLNGIGICLMHQRKYNEAEKYFLQALEKNSSDPESIINLIASYQQTGKPNEIITRQINQLKTVVPSHWWLSNLKRAEENFDLHASQFAI